MSEASTDPEYVLRGVAGAAFGRTYHLLAPTSVGRAPECDICLASAGISRMHARLRPREYGIEVEDLRSTNGSFLNGQRITVGIARIGDEIAFDQLRFRVGGVPRGHSRAADATASREVRPRPRWPWAAVIAALVGATLATRWLMG